MLTQRADALTGTDGDDTFEAPVTQNETGSGALANTFETGDVLNGGEGNDVLRADLIATGTIQDSQQGAAITATTSGIEEVRLTAITPQNDANNNTAIVSTVDAGRMTGVEQWWTDNSRSNVTIEDIRSATEDTTFGMFETDPNVAFQAFFNPLFMEGNVDNGSSSFSFVIAETNDAAAELANINVFAINFEHEGEYYSLDSDAVREADTWADLQTALQAEVDAEAALEGLTVTHVGGGVFTVTDPAAGTFDIDPAGTVVTSSTTLETKDAALGRLDPEEGPTVTNLVLDGAGNGSQGGAVNIAAMSGDRGIEVMNVMVGRNSHIASLASENNEANTPSGYQTEQQLEEVYVTHTAACEGTLQIGTRTVDTLGVSTTTDDRLNTNGLTDVRVFDASGFDAELKLGAQLTGNAFDKYLADAEDTVQFSYLLGDAGSNLNLAVNNTLAGDVDFALEVVGGAGDDRINLSGLAVKQQTSVDGGEGENTLEVNTSTGFAATAAGQDIVVPNAATDLTAAQTSFASVENIDNVVIAGTGNTTHDVTAAGFAGVESFVIATDGLDNTRLINLDVDTQSVNVSGKNQTLGNGNSDNNQTFGTVRLSDTDGEVLDLALNNTARATGTLTVNALTIDDTAGNVSEVRTLNLDSVGTRQTSNIVTTLNGNLVNTFNLEGTQDLTITNLASAANSTDAVAANRDNLEVNASTLEGDLYLGVTGAVVTAVDAALGTNRTVELIGTEGESDILNIRDGVTTTNATTISGFETIRFGEGAQIIAATNFNATNVSDVELYDLVDTNGAGTINLNNLRATENVQINSDNTNGTDVVADVTLAAANPTTGSQINVNFAANTTGGGVDANFWGLVGGANLNVQDFSTIALDMGGIAGDSYDYDFNLNTLANPTSGNVNARTLEITGGQFDAGFTNLDSVTLNQLDTALTTVDFSGYNGNFITDGWNSTTGSNAEVIVNEFGMQFDIGGNNTLFTVGAGAGAAAEVQGIDFTGNAGAFGDLADGESITITFAGGQYTFTNDTGAAIVNADIADAIFADAANAPAAFTITQPGGAGTPIDVTATRNGDMPGATVTASDVANVVGGGNVAVGDDDVQGGLASGVPTEFVTIESEFLTKFTFTEDVAAQGIVWQIDNFQPFDGVDNVSLNTQTQIDLRQLGVDSSTKITIEDGATYWASLDAAEQAAFTAAGNAAVVSNAANTVISSNDDLDFAIVLTGVDSNNLGNENIVGIA
jgi:hypothetical protein